METKYRADLKRGLNVSHELKMKVGFEVQACKDMMQLTWTHQGVNRKLGRKGMSRSWHLL